MVKLFSHKPASNLKKYTYKSKMTRPWKNGYWYSYNERHVIQIVEGNSVKGMMHTVLDVPEAKPTFNLTWTFGDFGPAKDVISEATGTYVE